MKKEHATDPSLVKGMLIEEITEMLSEGAEEEENLPAPTVMLVIGVNGVGKFLGSGSGSAFSRSSGSSGLTGSGASGSSAVISSGSAVSSGSSDVIGKARWSMLT